MVILKATDLGMCFGVRDAIHMALAQPEPLTILGDLVHNETVLEHLRSQGVKIEHQVAAVSTPTVMITAHGASDITKQKLTDRGLRVIEATCPLVHYAHQAVQDLAAQGFHPVVIGLRHHVEVRGLTEDFPEFDVVLSEADIDALAPRPRFGVVAQTTQPLARAHHLLACLQRRFPESEVRWVDTVCQPTKRRQEAAVRLAQSSDVVLVIGGEHSNNTRELTETCRRFCTRVHQVRGPQDLDPEWIKGAGTVGITAGTSTPDELIAAVERRLTEWGGTQAMPGSKPTALEKRTFQSSVHALNWPGDGRSALG